MFFSLKREGSEARFQNQKLYEKLSIIESSIFNELNGQNGNDIEQTVRDKISDKIGVIILQESFQDKDVKEMFSRLINS